MNLDNFSLLSVEEKKQIYSFLIDKYSETNLCYFIQENHSLIKKDINLSNKFNEAHWEIFENLFDFEKLNQEKIKTIINLLNDAEKIIESLKIFNQRNLCFDVSIALAGGALRDLILMESPRIKDLDFIVSFKYSDDLISKGFVGTAISLETDNIILKEGIKEANNNLSDMGLEAFDITRISPGIDVGISAGHFIFHVVSQLIKKNFNVENEFWGSLKNIATIENLENNFGSENRHLSGVIKIKDHNLNFDIDLLLTSVDIDKYLDAFDYSICKMMINLLEYGDKNFKMISTPNQFLKRIEISTEIYDDILNKKLSFNTDNFSIDEIQRSLTNHYPRLKEKYNEYELNLISPRNIHSIEDLDKLGLMIELNETLNLKESVYPTKKIKL